MFASIAVRDRRALAIVALCAGGLIACSSSEEPSSIHTSVSWAYEFGTVAELRAAADLIAVVEVVEDRAVPSEPGSQRTVSFSNREVRVIESFAGAEGPTRIRIRQTDGISDDPLLVVGEQYLVFARYAESADVYVILGGPQGRFVIRGDAAVPLSQVYPGRGTGGLREPIALDDLRASDPEP